MKKKMSVAVMVTLSLVMVVSFQNCSDSGMEFNENSLSGLHSLVYGKTSDDRDFFQKRIEGYNRPSLEQIFNQWSRISGQQYYNRVTDIKQESKLSFCYSGLDANGDWNKITFEGNSNKNPGTLAECIASNAFNSLSWSYVKATKSLKVASNASRLTGFVSGVPFDNFISEATVSSEQSDDDNIIMVIASRKIGSDVHALVATRSHGGYLAPSLGWGVLYYKNGNIVKALANKSVGGVFSSTDTTLPSAERGWRGRKSRIKVERRGDQIIAYASNWSKVDSQLVYDPSSKIVVNLNSDEALKIFKGPQQYGYASHSQYGATFSNIEFTALVDNEYVFDLENNYVYKLLHDGSGRYVRDSRADAFKLLGYPRTVINHETQKTFKLTHYRGYELIESGLE